MDSTDGLAVECPINWLIASEGRARLHGPSDDAVADGADMSAVKHLDLWPQTIGIQDYPMPEIQGPQSRTPST